MAKATSQLSPTSIAGNLNIDQGAAAVLALINRSPRTPSFEEIRAVLGIPAPDQPRCFICGRTSDDLPLYSYDGGITYRVARRTASRTSVTPQGGCW